MNRSNSAFINIKVKLLSSIGLCRIFTSLLKFLVEIVI